MEHSSVGGRIQPYSVINLYPSDLVPRATYPGRKRLDGHLVEHKAAAHLLGMRWLLRPVVTMAAPGDVHDRGGPNAHTVRPGQPVGGAAGSPCPPVGLGGGYDCLRRHHDGHDR